MEKVKTWVELPNFTYDDILALAGKQVKGYGMKGEFVGNVVKSIRDDSLWIESNDDAANNPSTFSYGAYKYTYPVFDDLRRKTPHIQRIDKAVDKEQAEITQNAIDEKLEPIRISLKKLLECNIEIDVLEDKLSSLKYKKHSLLNELGKLALDENK